MPAGIDCQRTDHFHTSSFTRMQPASPLPEVVGFFSGRDDLATGGLGLSLGQPLCLHRQEIEAGPWWAREARLLRREALSSPAVLLCASLLSACGCQALPWEGREKTIALVHGEHPQQAFLGPGLASGSQISGSLDTRGTFVFSPSGPGGGPRWSYRGWTSLALSHCWSHISQTQALDPGSLEECSV